MTASANRTEPLRLPPPSQGWGNIFWTLFGLVALAALLVACAVFTAPPVLSDWQVRDTARPVAEARVTDGKCSASVRTHNGGADGSGVIHGSHGRGRWISSG